MLPPFASCPPVLAKAPFYFFLLRTFLGRTPVSFVVLLQVFAPRGECRSCHPWSCYLHAQVGLICRSHSGLLLATALHVSLQLCTLKLWEIINKLKRKKKKQKWKRNLFFIVLRDHDPSIWSGHRLSAWASPHLGNPHSTSSSSSKKLLTAPHFSSSWHTSSSLFTILPLSVHSVTVFIYRVLVLWAPSLCCRYGLHYEGFIWLMPSDLVPYETTRHQAEGKILNTLKPITSRIWMWNEDCCLAGLFVISLMGFLCTFLSLYHSENTFC